MLLPLKRKPRPFPIRSHPRALLPPRPFMIRVLGSPMLMPCLSAKMRPPLTRIRSLTLIQSHPTMTSLWKISICRTANYPIWRPSLYRRYPKKIHERLTPTIRRTKSVIHMV
jgi:hypothetical protein